MTKKEFIKENESELIDWIRDAINEFDDRIYHAKIKQYLINAVNDFLEENNQNLQLITMDNYLKNEFNRKDSFYKITHTSKLAYNSQNFTGMLKLLSI